MCHAAIWACDNTNPSDKALERLEWMRKNGLEPEVMTCNSYWAGEKAKQSDNASELLA